MTGALAGLDHRSTSHPWHPSVSVVIPVLDEEEHIEECLHSVLGQTYDGLDEVIVADGGSRDRTRLIVKAMSAADPRLRLIDNPKRTQAAGLNRAIAVSRGDVVARLDGHAAWPAGHLERCVALLAETGADNVGGTMDAVGSTAIGEAIARATQSLLGAGGATYRRGRTQRDVDTVWLGCFRRSALERVGPFDERFPPHEDYELNHRIRRTGGRVVYSPELPTRYWPRESWGAVARQYYGYGRGKVRVARRFPGVLRPYHLAAPLFFGGTACAGLRTLAGRHRGAAVLAAAYGVGCAAASVPAGRHAPIGVRLRIPVVYPLLHLAWGLGFWAGVLEVLDPRHALRGIARR